MTEEVSRVVALAWGAEAAPQRGPKRELSLERIVEAAIEIADSEGLQAVTMQRVAKTFGYTTMAMYRYVANKDDLQRLMVDAAGRGITAVDDEDWRLGLEQLARWMLGMYRAHPWLLDIPVYAETMLMPEQMRATDTALRAMRTLPISGGERLLLLMTLSTFVRAHASLMRELSNPSAKASEPTKQLVQDAVESGKYPDLAPLVASGLYLSAPADAELPEEVTELDLMQSLQIWFDGIEAGIASRQDGATPEAYDDERPARERSPEVALAEAEHELDSVIELRKATQRRVRELEKREAVARKRRDAAKESAKAAAKLRR